MQIQNGFRDNITGLRNEYQEYLSVNQTTDDDVMTNSNVITPFSPRFGMEVVDGSTTLRIFQSVAAYIGGYFNILFIIIGVFGNMMSVFIFARHRQRDTATALYLGILAVADTFSLVGFGLPIWAYQGLRFISKGVLGNTKEMPNSIMCKFYLYIYRNSSFMSAWLIVIFSMERCFAVWRPLHVCDVVTSGRRKIAVTSLFIFSLLIWIPLFFMIELTPFPPGQDKFQLCTLPPRSPLYVYIVYIVGLVYINAGIPLLFIVTLNTMIIAGIYKAKESLINPVHGSKGNKEMKCLVNLLFVSTTYFFIMSPFAISWTIWVWYNLTGFTGVDQSTKALLAEVAAFTQSLTMLNHSLNVFIYTYTLDYYRRELKNIMVMVCCCRRVKEERKWTTTPSSSQLG